MMSCFLKSVVLFLASVKVNAIMVQYKSELNFLYSVYHRYSMPLLMAIHSVFFKVEHLNR
jgi:hypothetical protein